MLAHWLQPDEVTGHGASWQIGARVTSFFPEMADIPRGVVALLGYDPKAASAIRRQLWPLAWSFGKTEVVDLGNLRKAEPAFAVQVLRELIDGGIIVVLFGGPEDLALGQYQAYSEKIKGVNACILSSRLDYRAEVEEARPPLLNRMMIPGQNHLFHLSVLGWQRHFCDPAVTRDLVAEHHFELFSLGQVRHNLEEAEPPIRDADMVAIQMAVLQAAFAPAALQAGPNGFDGMEICRLARYAGISEKLSSFSLGGWQPSRDRQHRTAQLCAQIIWYFLEGYSQRQDDFPVSMEGLMEYRVDHSHLSEALVFWKSTRTGRWWLQVPVREDAGHERHRLVPCTYRDYQEACKDELPERLLQAQMRFR
jgi:formiminoglutamase